jgi:hypothetical protein
MYFLKRLAIQIASLIAVVPLAGCAHAPTFNILGSYFPACYCVSSPALRGPLP